MQIEPVASVCRRRVQEGPWAASADELTHTPSAGKTTSRNQSLGAAQGQTPARVTGSSTAHSLPLPIPLRIVDTFPARSERSDFTLHSFTNT